jgi:hypothetical protein
MRPPTSRIALIAALAMTAMATDEPLPDPLPELFRDNEKIQTAEAKRARRAAKRKARK